MEGGLSWLHGAYCVVCFEGVAEKLSEGGRKEKQSREGEE